MFPSWVPRIIGPSQQDVVDQPNAQAARIAHLIHDRRLVAHPEITWKVVSASLARRNLIKRRRVMALAMIYPEPEMRAQGRSERRRNPAAIDVRPFAKFGAQKMAKVATSAAYNGEDR